MLAFILYPEYVGIIPSSGLCICFSHCCGQFCIRSLHGCLLTVYVSGQVSSWKSPPCVTLSNAVAPFSNIPFQNYPVPLLYMATAVLVVCICVYSGKVCLSGYVSVWERGEEEGYWVQCAQDGWLHVCPGPVCTLSLRGLQFGGASSSGPGGVGGSSSSPFHRTRALAQGSLRLSQCQLTLGMIQASGLHSIFCLGGLLMSLAFQVPFCPPRPASQLLGQP